MGAVMSYALALSGRRPAPAGVIALSGFIPTVEGYEPHFEDRDGLPVAIGHGTQDPIISIDFARRDRETLEAAGLPVTYRESPMAHSVDPSFAAELRGWIEERLGG
jgi:phospholipase/carboxylesterase